MQLPEATNREEFEQHYDKIVDETYQLYQKVIDENPNLQGKEDVDNPEDASSIREVWFETREQLLTGLAILNALQLQYSQKNNVEQGMFGEFLHEPLNRLYTLVTFLDLVYLEESEVQGHHVQ